MNGKSFCLLVFWWFICTIPLAVFFGCSNEVSVKYPIEEIGGIKFEVITSKSGCQYYYKTESYNRILCHKGDCNNPIHQGLEKPDEQVRFSEDRPLLINAGDGKTLSVQYDGSMMIVKPVKK